MTDSVFKFDDARAVYEYLASQTRRKGSNQGVLIREAWIKDSCWQPCLGHQPCVRAQ
jgi:hypothetical protein